MNAIIWDDSFQVGVEEIDSQHKDFLRLINRLGVMDEKNAPRSWILRLLLELVKYWEYHAISEENLMIFSQYPELKQQQSDHERFLITLNAKIRSYEAGEEDIQAIIAVFMHWFTRHTAVADKKAAEHILNTVRDRAESG